jgi:hypothetical protein
MRSEFATASFLLGGRHHWADTVRIFAGTNEIKGEETIERAAQICECLRGQPIDINDRCKHPNQKLCLNHISHWLMNFSAECNGVSPCPKILLYQYCASSASNRSFFVQLIYNCIFMVTSKNGLVISAIELPVSAFRRELLC